MQLLEVQATVSAGRSEAKPSPGKNRYLAMVEDRIDRQWVALPLLANTPLVVMKFRISRLGEISRLHIAESSGNSHYDSLAQRAVQSVNPLPSFPPDVSESFFDVQYRFIKD
jgi:TonB family protein